MLANQQRHGAAFDAHGGAQIEAARCVRIRHAFVLANARQMAHDLDWRHVAGEYDDATERNTAGGVQLALRMMFAVVVVVVCCCLVHSPSFTLVQSALHVLQAVAQERLVLAR